MSDENLNLRSDLTDEHKAIRDAIRNSWTPREEARRRGVLADSEGFTMFKMPVALGRSKSELLGPGKFRRKVKK